MRIPPKYFDQKFDALSKKIDKQTQELKTYAAEIRRELDVRKEVEQLKVQMQEIRAALAMNGNKKRSI